MSRRRDFIAGLAGFSFLSGCSSLQEPTESESGRTYGSKTTQTISRTTREPTSSNRTTNAATLKSEERFSFGEWYEYKDWELSPQSLEIMTEYRLEENGEVRELPSGKQLVITEIHIKTSLIEDAWGANGQFAFIIDDETIQTTSETELPDDFPGLGRLEGIEHILQFSTNDGYHVEDSETGKMWYATIISDSKNESDIEVGFDPIFNDSILYPIRWS